MQNYNCDGDHCTVPDGIIKVLPTGGDSNALLCYSCYLHEMQFRRERNKELCKESQFDLPAWDSLKRYNNVQLGSAI